MKFSDKREEFVYTIETVCLFICLGAIFFQIWILLSAIESSFKGNLKLLLPSMILSGLAFITCGVSILLTNMDFLKEMTEGRSKTYQKKV